MVSNIVKLFLLVFISAALIVVIRRMRLNPSSLENFQMPVLYGQRARACGVGMHSCFSGTKCGNGLCINTEVEALQEKYPLPVLPARL
jgi:hypothetical protein